MRPEGGGEREGVFEALTTKVRQKSRVLGCARLRGFCYKRSNRSAHGAFQSVSGELFFLLWPQDYIVRWTPAHTLRAGFNRPAIGVGSMACICHSASLFVVSCFHPIPCQRRGLYLHFPHPFTARWTPPATRAFLFCRVPDVGPGEISDLPASFPSPNPCRCSECRWDHSKAPNHARL